MKAIEKAGDMRTSYLQSSPPELKMLKQVPVDQIFRGDMFSPFDAPLNLNGDNVPVLGDRVVNLTSVGVPFGLKGTVVVIHSSTGYVEVIFDEEFIGGRSLQGNCSQFRGRLCPWSGLLRIPNPLLKLQQHSRSSVSASASISVHSSRSGPAVPHSTGADSRTSLSSPAVNLRPSPRAAPSGHNAPESTQQTAKLVHLLKSQKTEEGSKAGHADGKKSERANPEKSKSILNMLNAPISEAPVASTADPKKVTNPAPVQSKKMTNMLKSALLSSSSPEQPEQPKQAAQEEGAVDVSKSVQLKSFLAATTVESHVEPEIAIAATSDVSPKKEKKATMLIPSKVLVKNSKKN